jgi:hypothetical protein
MNDENVILQLKLEPTEKILIGGIVGLYVDDNNIISLFMSLSLKLIMILLFSDQR